jgi:SecD/SecF fusion protein
MRRTGRLVAIAGVVIAVSFTGIWVSGFDLGLEFSGGRLLEYQPTETVDQEELRSQLADIGFPRAVVQMSGQGNLIIRTEQLTPEEEAAIQDVVQSATGGAERVRDQFVGPTLGTELRNKALIALGVALTVQFIYLAIRFRWTMGVAAVTSMFHDVVVLIGLFAWLGKTIDGVFLAALLTVIGYSINDSVVIFDRIREQRKAHPDSPVDAVTNDACIQTIPRTINTGLGAIFILVAMWVLGGDTLADFALALLIGIIAGTYSSVFVAAPVYARLENRYPAPIAEPDEPKKASKSGRTTAKR